MLGVRVRITYFFALVPNKACRWFPESFLNFLAEQEPEMGEKFVHFTQPDLTLGSSAIAFWDYVVMC